MHWKETTDGHRSHHSVRRSVVSKGSRKTNVKKNVFKFICISVLFVFVCVPAAWVPLCDCLMILLSIAMLVGGSTLVHFGPDWIKNDFPGKLLQIFKVPRWRWSHHDFYGLTMGLFFAFQSEISWQLLGGLQWNLVGLHFWGKHPGWIVVTLVISWLFLYCANIKSNLLS